MASQALASPVYVSFLLKTHHPKKQKPNLYGAAETSAPHMLGDYPVGALRSLRELGPSNFDGFGLMDALCQLLERRSEFAARCTTTLQTLSIKTSTPKKSETGILAAPPLPNNGSFLPRNRNFP
jgi:hypothetical protein